MTTTQDPITRRRHAVGELLETWRIKRGLTVETAAERAGVSTVTYRRIELGEPARDMSYAALEDFLRLWPGTLRQALRSDEAVPALGQTLGVSEAVWPVAQLSATVSNLIAYLRRVGRPSLAELAALHALTTWHVELTVDHSGDKPVDSLRKL